jgi:cyanophycin synthetase
MSVTLDRKATANRETSSGDAIPVPVPATFSIWREAVRRRGALPVVAVAGSRGKTTVARFLDEIFTTAGLSTATWTDSGVEIRGHRQGSELGAWGEAMRRLAAGTLDVAVQELDWPTVHAVGLPPDAYPVAVVTNICVNNDRCLVRAETRMAIRAYERVRDAARRDGVLVLNGDDYAVAGTEVERETPAFLVGLNPDAPILRSHLSEGGRAAWLERGWITLGTATAALRVCRADQLPSALAGAATFEVQNALLAAGVAHVCGIDEQTIAAALATFRVPPAAAGSFNVVPIGEALAVLDRPAPSWFLRSVLRVLRHRPHRRFIVVAGVLEQVPDEDLDEVGRLLARTSDAMLFHSEEAAPERSSLFLSGVESGAGPMVLIKLRTERQALARAVKRLRPGDLLLVLADQPVPALRALQRAAGASPANPATSAISFEDGLSPADD